MTKITDPLCLSIDRGYAGANWRDNRSTFFDLSHVSFSGGTWYRDEGPEGFAQPEPRAFCIAGAATFAFTGSALYIRLNIAWSWFTASTLRIDGVAPSTLGLLTAVDTLSCDAATYLLNNDGYIDVLVADGLAAGAHTCTITVLSPDPSKFFSMSGYKTGQLSSVAVTREGGWLVPTSYLYGANLTTLTLTNRSTNTVIGPILSFPSGLRAANGAALSSLAAASLAPGAALTQTVLPVFTGNEVSGSFAYDLGLTAHYVDPLGTLGSTTVTTLLADNPALVKSGTWYQDASTPTGQLRTYATSNLSTITLSFEGDSLTFLLHCSLTWGVIGIYSGATLLNTVTCNVDSVPLVTQTVTGFGTGTHTVTLKKTVADSNPIVIVAIAYSVTRLYGTTTETVRLTYQAHQPYALPISGVSAPSAERVSFSPPVVNARDYSTTPARQNTDMPWVEVLARPPTFAVYYKAGQRALLAGYDRLIVDPFAARVADVQYWQAQGIKVYGYVSAGAETGVYSNRYDFTTPLGPWTGAGPGGYATYYMHTQSPSAPDRDPIWASYYINPDPAFGWPARLHDFYAPLVLSGPSPVVEEVVTTSTATISAGSRIVFNVAHTPVDLDQPVTIKTLDRSTTYARSDFTFDSKTGAFVLAASIAPAVVAGDQLRVSYTRKGHFMDGIFLDTVDNVDIYNGGWPGYPLVAGYATRFAAMINTLKTAFPSAALISNRGFSILDNIIHSCDGVMFETGLTTATNPADLTGTDYQIITDSTSLAYNQAADAQLASLRRSYPFDVYSLNYCHNGPAGDALRAYCRAQDSGKNYFSWQSIITLDDPLPNSAQFVRTALLSL